MKICYGVMAHITHFRFLPISPLIFATVQKFALDYLRDQQILTPPCEWGWVVVVPLLGTTLEVEDSPDMVCDLNNHMKRKHENIFKKQNYPKIPKLKKEGYQIEFENIKLKDHEIRDTLL